MGDNRERVDWVQKVASGVPTNKLDAHKLAAARERHGVEVEFMGQGKADIYKTVVEGMPAPRQRGFWQRLFGLDKGE